MLALSSALSSTSLLSSSPFRMSSVLRWLPRILVRSIPFRKAPKPLVLLAAVGQFVWSLDQIHNKRMPHSLQPPLFFFLKAVRPKELPIIVITDCCRMESEAGAVFNQHHYPLFHCSRTSLKSTTK